VLTFAEAHEFRMGDSEWHVFLTNGNGFAICPRDGKQPVAVFHAESDYGNVSICWDPRSLLSFWSHTDIWDAEAAHDWLACLLQHVVTWKERDTGYSLVARFVRRLWPKRGQRTGSASQPEHVWVGISQRQSDLPQSAGVAFRSYKALWTTVHAMQSHYCVGGSADCVRGSSAAGVYEFLGWCARTFDPAGRHTVHAHRALGGKPDTSFTDMVDQAVVKYRSSTVVHSRVMDLPLRAVVEMLQDPAGKDREDTLLDAAVMHLGSLYEDYRFQAYMKRFASRPW
jgi:hypothetical protein